MPNTIDAGKLCMGCMSALENPNEPCPKCGFNLNNYQPAAHHLKPYTILSGKYLVGKVLGEGGFGITYLGWDLNLDIKIAIKEYYPAGLVTREITSTGTSSVTPFSGDKKEYYQSGLDKFINEAKSLAKFYTLPGIAAVKDFFRENGTAYIVMEFIDGITLKQHLANSGGKIRPNEVLELMKPIMKSLSQVHAEGIIHRDISPDNIMLTSKGDVKLLDFGAARDFISDGNKSLSVLLKPGYAPEEQYRTKGHQGPWTDVYALCATMYKVITGITPPESLDRFRKDELMRPSTMGIQLSPRIESALMKGMAVFESDRYQNVESLYNDIYGQTQQPAVNPDNNRIPIGQGTYMTPADSAKIQYNDVIPGTRNSRKYKIPAIMTIVCAAIAVAAIIIIPGLLHGNTLTASTNPPVSNTVLNTGNGTSGNSPETTNSPVNNTTPDTGNSSNIQNTIGNTSSNISNEGIAAQQGDWIYYRNCSDHNYLYKINANGTGNTRLNTGYTHYINVTGNWIYYCNGNELYKVHTDGTGNTRLISGCAVAKVNVVGDLIFYLNASDNFSLYRVRTDGTENTKLNSGRTFDISADGDWIYYTLMSDISTPSEGYKMHIDGTENTRLGSGIYSLIADGDWIYYYDLSRNLSKCKIHTNGSGEIKLGSISSDAFPTFKMNVSGDWIYYIGNISGNLCLCKIRTDGTGQTIICKDNVSNINVIGDWVYYENSVDHLLYRIRTDGSDRQRFGTAN